MREGGGAKSGCAWDVVWEGWRSCLYEVCIAAGPIAVFIHEPSHVEARSEGLCIAVHIADGNDAVGCGEEGLDGIYVL